MSDKTSNTAAVSPDQRNLVVVLCDQLRRDALGCHGDQNVKTPHIDALAARGVKFNNTCSTYPICVPFRFTMMTGQYAHTRMIPGIEWRMSPAERTLADEFNDAGYETLYVGKWHLMGGMLHMPGYSAVTEGTKPVPGLYRGRWKHWRGFELRNDPFDTCYFVDDDPTPVPIEGYQTDGLFDVAMQEMANLKGKQNGFACVISIEPPHPPFDAPAALEDKWRDVDLKLPPNFQPRDEAHRQQLLHDRRQYYAMVENIDQNMGRLAQFLDAQGLTENTTVVFMADHGEHGGSHGRSDKQTPYEESVGTPLVIAGPGISPASDGPRQIDLPTCTEDYFPTFLGLMGLSPRDEVPGENLTALIRGETRSLDRDGVMLQFVSEIRKGMLYFDATWRAWRSERYLYAVKGDLYGAKPWLLFDLQEDPYELNNLVDDPAAQAIAAAHHKALRDRLIETQDDYALAPAHGCGALNVHVTPLKER